MFIAKKKILIVNVDDLGLDIGSGEAFLELQKHGSVNSGSVMVPCPWFSQIVELYRTNPHLSIGIHLTLTSEWQRYRWRPLTTNRISSGLIDSSGFFWRNRKLLREYLNLRSAEIELNAQIRTALNAGIQITHIDCHMGVGLIPELVGVYLKLGIKYNLPVLFPKNIEVLKSINSLLDSQDFHIHQKILFGNTKYKRWTGYSIGYWLVKEFREQQAKLSWKEIMKMKPKDILEAVIETKA